MHPTFSHGSSYKFIVWILLIYSSFPLSDCELPVLSLIRLIKTDETQGMSIVQKAWSMAAKTYQGMVSKRLAAYGLKLEDAYVETPDMEKALNRIDPQVLVERERRIKRAFDLSAKRKELPLDMQQKVDPLGLYLEEHLEIAKRDREEREQLNNY